MKPGLSVAALGTNQILGWGCAYFLPGVLGSDIERDLGLPAGGAFAGTAILLTLSGLLAPRVGRAIDRFGARIAMATGSAAFAAGLLLLGLSETMAQGLIACLVIGLAGALSLTEAANAALAALGAEGARRRMVLLALLSGLASAIAWPGFAALDAALGWRGAVLAAAALHLLVALPLHLFCLPRQKRGRRAPPAAAQPLPPRLRWLSAAFTLQVLVGSAVLGHMVTLVEAQGVSRGGAIALAALAGPAQVASRLLDLMGGARFPAPRVAAAAMLAMPAALLVPLLVAGAAPLFVIAYGMASGIMSVMRPACIIELHGTEGYGAVAGRVMAPVTTAMAIAPFGFALLLNAAGVQVALAAAAVTMLLAWALLRQAMRSV